MQTPAHPIIVLGSSAGGREALPVVLENLPKDLPASVLAVQHLSGEEMGEVFLRNLSKRSRLPCAFGVDSEPLRPGRVYLAPPDLHLLITREGLRTSRGPRENGFRPSIDTLFRSAGAHYDGSVIGVILSGLRDDGVEGLAAIARCGGVTVVQDPRNAPYPEMPQAALNRVKVDYVVATIEMGLVLNDLVYRPPKPPVPIPEDIAGEARIAQWVLTNLEAIEQIGTATAYTCPACRGVLWDVEHDRQVHSYRCNAGHAFSPDSLLHYKSTEVEETLWACLRLLEEQKRMLTAFTRSGSGAPSHQMRLAENQRYIDQLRRLPLGGATGEAGPGVAEK